MGLIEQIGNSTYTGFKMVEEAIKLENGSWEGSPYVEDGSSKAHIYILDNFLLEGDLDGDNMDEVVTFLGESGGGSGEYIYLALLKKSENGLVNLQTKFLGDRIQIKEAIIKDKHLHLDLLRCGPNDATCCPGELIREIWQLKSGDFIISTDKEGPRRLSLSDIGATEWILKYWNAKEEAPSEPKISLLFKDGKFAGNSGCNRYFTPVTPGDNPGMISTGMAGSTMMACPDSIMKIEQRFLSLLAGINKFGFINTKLTLSYHNENNDDILIFERPKK